MALRQAAGRYAAGAGTVGGQNRSSPDSKGPPFDWLRDRRVGQNRSSPDSKGRPFDWPLGRYAAGAGTEWA